LGKNGRWVQGDLRWAVTHQGQTFWTSGAIQRECFLADPERYVPAHSGSDPVLLLDERRDVPGKVDYCVSYHGRLYMFCSGATQAKFRQAPERYSTAAGR
jgi:YHS domain-containing protein